MMWRLAVLRLCGKRDAIADAVVSHDDIWCGQRGRRRRRIRLCELHQEGLLLLLLLLWQRRLLVRVVEFISLGRPLHNSATTGLNRHHRVIGDI